MNFDNEVLAYLSTRKDELMQQHDEYIAEHLEIREVLNDFLSSVLLSKPVSNLLERPEVHHLSSTQHFESRWPVRHRHNRSIARIQSGRCPNTYHQLVVCLLG